MKLHIVFRYVGTNFCGYQFQPQKRTVQEEITRAVMEVFGKPCDVTGCSRTDSGVHALAFHATVTDKKQKSLQTNIALEKIPLALNAHLPEDITVYLAAWENEDFHARYAVKKKEYIYRIWNAPAFNPFEKDRAAHVPHTFSNEDIENMQHAALNLCGTHDFAAFMAVGSKIENTIRTIYSCKVEKDNELLTIRISADGFLYNMVRIIAGTLVFVGEGKITPEQIQTILSNKDRKYAGPTLPACGLYLNKVEY